MESVSTRPNAVDNDMAWFDVYLGASIYSVRAGSEDSALERAHDYHCDVFTDSVDHDNDGLVSLPLVVAVSPDDNAHRDFMQIHGRPDITHIGFQDPRKSSRSNRSAGRGMSIGARANQYKFFTSVFVGDIPRYTYNLDVLDETTRVRMESIATGLSRIAIVR